MRDRLPLIFSTTALLVAVLGATPLGEAAYNQVVPRNSVGTLQLKRNAVTSSKLAPNTVRTGQIVNASLLADDFKAGQLPAGPKGDKGNKGDKGDRGPAGPVGISGYEIVQASATVNANTTLSAIQPTCPAGKKVLGGTATVQGLAGSGFFFGTNVFGASTGANDIYSVTVTNTTAVARQVFAQAICARVAG
jgi:hypothetical protein